MAVVDTEGRLEGILARTDLVDAPETARAGDVMTRRVHALPEDAPLSFAVALFTQADISEIPLVSTDGMVTGIAHSLDLMRWVGGRLGYGDR